MPTAQDPPDDGATAAAVGQAGDGTKSAPAAPDTADPNTSELNTAAVPAPDATGQRLAEAEDRWRRAVADLENLRKRTVREIESARARERAGVAVVFLPVVDGLEQAIAFVPAEDEALRSGIEVVHASAVDGLGRLGYPRIDQTGVAFDPRVHEVVSVVENPDLPPQTVVAVIRPGYGTPSSMLRPAGVVVTAAGT